MIHSTKASDQADSLVIRIITVATFLSGFIQILCLMGPINQLNIKDGILVDLGIRKGNNATESCGDLGCMGVPNVTFIFGDDARKYIEGPGNQSVNYNDTVPLTLSCPPVDKNDTMIYWVSTRHLIKDSMTLEIVNGTFRKNNVTLDKRHELTLTNMTGYDQRWYICILNKKKETAITYGYLEVIGDPNPKAYVEEQPQEDVVNISSGTVKRSEQNDLMPGIIAAGVLFLIALLTIIGVTVFKRRRSSSVIVKYWMKKVTVEKPLVDNTNPDAGDLVIPIVKIEKQKLTQMGIKGNDHTLMSEYQLPADTQWEVLRTSMSLTGKVLGEGEFGKVVKAECDGIISEGVKTVVAVKMLKEGHSDADMIALVSEMEIMKMIGKHENIINLLGCCTQDGPLYVVVEYARNGCLREFLKQHKPNNKSGSAEDLLNKRLTTRDLVDFGLQVAKGMEYLASRGCIHRDLAARNVLVSAECVLKVADFGLARDVRDSDYYRKRSAGKLPIKWMSPESILRNMYTKRSDVWSFGVLMWEIMTYGSTPYLNVPIPYLHQHLKTGNRLEKPAACSAEIYKIMKDCWAYEPEERPSFVDLVQTLKTMLHVDENLKEKKSMENKNLYH